MLWQLDGLGPLAPSVISSVSHFIAASQGPNFRHFSPDHPCAMCCNSIMYILSPVHQREGGADESNGSLTLVLQILPAPVESQRRPGDVKLPS